MLSCSIWFSAPSFWMGGGLESCCVGRVYGADGAVHGTICTAHTTYNIFPFIYGVYVAVSNMKMFSSDTETPCCRATKYFVLLLTIRSIKHCEYLYSCHKYSAYKWHFLCAI